MNTLDEVTNVFNPSLMTNVNLNNWKLEYTKKQLDFIIVSEACGFVPVPNSIITM